MQKITARGSLHAGNTVAKLSSTCGNCRERHVKCSGDAPCTRCAKDSLACIYRSSRRGQRGTPLQQKSLCINPGLNVDSPSNSVASRTCDSCRDRHLRCTGPPTCTRCAGNGTLCLFRTSRQGQRQIKRPATGVKSVKWAPVQTTLLSPCADNPGHEKTFWPRMVISEEVVDAKSARSYHYFREKTCHDLCRPQDREFWTSLVLRISHDQPAIKQILVALGSLHESLEIAYASWGDKEDQPLNIFSLGKYRAAIKQLKADNSSLTIEILLVSCLLLVYFETLQNDNKSAMNLLHSGLKLLPQWYAHSEVKDHVVRVFDRIRLQALTFFAETTREPDPQLLELSSIGQEVNATSSSFLDLTHAKASFDSITEEAYRIMNPILSTADYPLTYKLLFRFRNLLDSWFARFNNFIVHHWPNSIALPKELLFLRLQYRVASLLTAASPAWGQIRFDKNLEDFINIIADVATFLNIGDEGQYHTVTKEGEGGGGDTTLFCGFQKHNVIPALLICAFLCRRPSLRRKAVILLSTEDWFEPSWNSFVTEKAATWVFATEEHEARNPRTRDDVPQSCRIKLLEIVRLGQNLPTQDYQETESGLKATVPLARGHVRIDLAFALESQRVLLRYIGVLRALAYPM